MRLFHGTTKENLKALLLKKEEPISCWKCSDRDGMLYFYDHQKMIDCGECQEDNDTSLTIQRAFENAQIQAAFKGISTELYVIELSLSEKLVEDDFSCDNMHLMASCTDTENISVDSIVKVYKCEFNHWYSPIILSCMLTNDDFNHEDVDYILYAVANALNKSDISCYLDEMSDFDFYEISMDRLMADLAIEHLML